MKKETRIWTSHVGYECVAQINSLGVWCGYVIVPLEHPLSGLHYYGVEELHNIDIHGGLTYAARTEDGWAFGFDCGHAGDLIPGAGVKVSDGETYKDLFFVIIECEKLAKQLRDICSTR